MIRNKKDNINLLWIVGVLIAYLLPLFMCLFIIYRGDIPFWYDPARDFILASENLKKLTLIGPTSGIPGIFYGPYWIWLISLGLIISKDPRVVVSLILTIPYFVIMPFILYKFSSVFGRIVSLILWVVASLSFVQSYATQPWNPHLAPLIFALIVFFITFSSSSLKTLKDHLLIFAIGILTGLLLNFHISFGIGVTFGVILFFFLQFMLEYKKIKIIVHLVNQIKILLLFFSGIVIVFSPFFLFEIRHGFFQTKVAIITVLSKTAVVSQRGLDTQGILTEFFMRFSDLLKVNFLILLLLLVMALVFIGIGYIKKQINLSSIERKLLLFLLSGAVSILFIYLTSKNPVWGYHFIGVEVIFLFLLGFLMSKIQLLRYILTGWLIIFVFLQLSGFSTTLRKDPIASSSLAAKKHIVQQIDEDAAGDEYAVFAYNPSIYIYDYAYLFQWLTRNNVSYKPEDMRIDAKTVYIILPSGASMEEKENFINFRSPNSEYETVKTWRIPDGTLILKREKKSILVFAFR